MINKPLKFSISRRGLSLIEVLISMFVLLFGLMGVAAIFPVGNHFASQGDRADRASVLAENAFAQLQTRGMLQPDVWYWPIIGGATAAPLPFINKVPDLRYNRAIGEFSVLHNDPNAGPGYAFVLDPLGAALGAYGGLTDADLFPIATVEQDEAGTFPQMPTIWNLDQTRWPVRRLTFQSPNPPNGPTATRVMPFQVAETIFGLRDDLAIALPEESDRPGVQRFTASSNGAPLARSSAGDYSWFATVVSPDRNAWRALQPADPAHGSHLYDVSVAVVQKRDVTNLSADSERMIGGRMAPGGELLISAVLEASVDKAVQDVREGQWVAVAGVDHIAGGNDAQDAVFLLKWYRILALDNATEKNVNSTLDNPYVRRLMLDGPAWPAEAEVRAIFMPGVVSVVTRPMKLSL